jgi:hypothetical protein
VKHHTDRLASGTGKLVTASPGSFSATCPAGAGNDRSLLQDAGAGLLSKTYSDFGQW